MMIVWQHCLIYVSVDMHLVLLYLRTEREGEREERGGYGGEKGERRERREGETTLYFMSYEWYFHNHVLSNLLFVKTREGPCQRGLLCGCKALRTWTDRPRGATSWRVLAADLLVCEPRAGDLARHAVGLVTRRKMYQTDLIFVARPSAILLFASSLQPTSSW